MSEEISWKDAAESASQSVRQQAFSRFEKLAGTERAEAALALLASPYEDLAETVLEVCPAEDVSRPEWTAALEAAAANAGALLRPRILVLLQRVEGELPPKIVEFCHAALHDADAETRYQAFCLAEMRGEDSEEYVAEVREWLKSDDEDFRIVAAQAVARIRPEWGRSALEARLIQAADVERFQMLLALLRILPDDERREYEPMLCACVEDGRFSFAAIEALAEYGTNHAVPVLLETARSFLGEPTVRVAAAGAAARLGSDEGRKLLQKFAKSRFGNPDYAKEILESL